MQTRISKPVLAITTVLLGACSDGALSPPRVSDLSASPGISAVKFWDVGSSVRWNRRAHDLLVLRGGNSSRVFTYLSLAQYRAVLAAKDAKDGGTHASPAGAAAGASIVILQSFYPADAVALNVELETQRAAPPWPGEQRKDFAAGEELGRAIGAAVLAFAATDNVNVVSPGTPPVGAGYWTSSGAPIVRALYGARPFFLTSGSELRAPPPPAFGSPAFLAALAEVRAITDGRTAEQLAIARKWFPVSGIVFNAVAADLIVAHHRTEIDAARILAYANAAAFDAIIGCFDSKFAYWYIRPFQADPLITTPIGRPNHPSYPSAHACEDGAFEAALSDAFPGDRAAIAEIAQEATDSRIFAGLHYRFDNDAGVALGRAAARLALERRGLE